MKNEKTIRAFVLGLIAGIAGTLLCVSTSILIRDAVLIHKYKEGQKIQAKAASDTEAVSEANAETVVNSATTYKMAVLEKYIKNCYYEDVDTDALAEGIYEGMLESLGDPYSEYYTVEEMQEIMADSSGLYKGIGAYISQDEVTKYPVISGVMSGTPAEEANLQTGDIIYKADDIDLGGMLPAEAVTYIKGEEGTKVKLTIVREGEKDFIEVEVERRTIETPTVEYEMMDDNLGYIQIKEFNEKTSDQFTEAMAVLKGQGMEGLVLDLRANGGGDVDTCVGVARQLLPEGLVVYTETKDGERVDYKCDGTREFDKPIVVLVNAYTASAAEILTGAIKDHNKGTIMGTKTFGKGIVQIISQLQDGSAVKITNSRYYTPNGNYIHKVGIEPDIEIPWDAELYKDGVDNQIEEAKKELLKQIDAQQ